MFAIADKALDNPTAALFASFGSITMLLFVDFGGPLRSRLESLVGLALTGLGLVCLGTACSQVVWLATVATAVVAFTILLLGVLSSVLARSSTSLLIAFVLPVTFPGPVSSIPDRALGWVMAAVGSAIAIACTSPRQPADPTFGALGDACTSLGRRLVAEADRIRSRTAVPTHAVPSPTAGPDRDAISRLGDSFFAAPYRPAGLGTEARVLVQVVEQVLLLDSMLERLIGDGIAEQCDPAATDALRIAGTLLADCGREVAAMYPDPERLGAEIARLRDASNALERNALSLVPPIDELTAATAIGVFDPSFRSQEVARIAVEIACNVQLAAVATRRSLWDRVIGRRPAELESTLSSARGRVTAHFDRHSVWLRNSVRGAVGLALTVLVADLLDVQHAFWVAFATLAVLRSNAVNTRNSALQAMLGTVVGVFLGGALVTVIGDHTAVAWVLLPLAVAFVGIAPTEISFTAGQAGFTVTLFILFDLVAPTGWSTGVVRLEDMLLGCAVSIIVSVLLWPRGAGAALRLAFAEGVLESSRYLTATVRFAVAHCDRASGDDVASPDPQRQEAIRAARRLDDAFRQYLAERGSKSLPFADVTALVVFVTVIRNVTDAIGELWATAPPAPSGDRSEGRREIAAATRSIAGWLDEAIAALTATGPALGPQRYDEPAADHLVAAVRDDLAGEDGDRAVTAVRMIWTLDQLTVLWALQQQIAPLIERAAARERSRFEWLVPARVSAAPLRHRHVRPARAGRAEGDARAPAAR
jgi:uncharacterized membrane protein YccC